MSPKEIPITEEVGEFTSQLEALGYFAPYGAFDSNDAKAIVAALLVVARSLRCLEYPLSPKERP